MSHWPTSLGIRPATYVWKPLPARVVAQTCDIPAGISQLFFSFLTFLLLFAQGGGAIFNYGTLTVKYGNFTGNSAEGVCVTAPHSSQCPYQNMLEIPARELEQFASEPELTVPLPQCVRDVPATLLQCFRNASTKFDFVAAL